MEKCSSIQIHKYSGENVAGSVSVPAHLFN